LRFGDVELSVSEGSSLKVLTPRSTEDSECVVRFLDLLLFGYMVTMDMVTERYVN